MGLFLSEGMWFMNVKLGEESPSELEERKCSGEVVGEKECTVGVLFDILIYLMILRSYMSSNELR
jgi:hypothetical protein